LGEAKWQHSPTRCMLVTSSSASSVLDTENGDVYIRRTARDYPNPPLAWHETHRNSSTVEWDMQWWHYGREKYAFVGTTVQRRTNAVWKKTWRSLGHALADLETWLSEWNKWLWKTAAWLWNKTAANAGISIGSVDTILHDELKLQKSCAIMSSDRLVRGWDSFGLFSHDVRPSLNCHTHERTFFTSITPSLHVSFNCWWISMGFMPRKWRNRIITRCSLNVNVTIFSI